MLPILIGLGAKWSARAEIESYAAVEQHPAGGERQLPRGDRRADHSDSIARRGHRRSRRPRQVDPAQARSDAEASGGREGPRGRRHRDDQRSRRQPSSPLRSPRPEDTFGVLRDLLGGLENRLRTCGATSNSGKQLAAATPSIWPAHGWLTGYFGGRSDPFTGEPGIPPGPRHLDRKRPAGLRHRRWHGRVGARTPATTAT